MPRAMRCTEPRVDTADVLTVLFKEQNSKKGLHITSMDALVQQLHDHPVLSQQELFGLITRAQQKGDIEARNKAVMHNIRFAASVAATFRGRGLDYTDLVHEGVQGLIEAVNRFDCNYGTTFSTYAIWWVEQTIKEALRKTGNFIKLPQSALLQQRRVAAAVEELTRIQERKPTPEEVTAETGIDLLSVAATMQRLAAPTVFLGDHAATQSGTPMTSLEAYVPDRITLNPEQRILAKSELKDACANIHLLCADSNFFSARNRKIFLLRYGLQSDLQKLSSCNVAKLFGVSRRCIDQIVAKSWARFKRNGLPFTPEWLRKQTNTVVLLAELFGLEVEDILGEISMSERNATF